MQSVVQHGDLAAHETGVDWMGPISDLQSSPPGQCAPSLYILLQHHTWIQYTGQVNQWERTEAHCLRDVPSPYRMYKVLPLCEGRGALGKPGSESSAWSIQCQSVSEETQYIQSQLCITSHLNSATLLYQNVAFPFSPSRHLTYTVHAGKPGRILRNTQYLPKTNYKSRHAVCWENDTLGDFVTSTAPPAAGSRTHSCHCLLSVCDSEC